MDTIEEDNEFSIYNFNSIINYIKDNYIQLLLLCLVFFIIYIVHYITDLNTILMSQMNIIPAQQNQKLKGHKISKK